ncbi:hypothetical protein CEXT_814301 [Caerostris extrusa]|uniref:Uncharacterized protein n=1 Tax=Caerostris extrusa TaxID=172846 RepID=A0AAV4QYM2_CAEEX|nr:hypothetical protein CEXT_814301 [Caerostris extrusa]
MEFKNHSKLSRPFLTDTRPRNRRISNNPTVLVPLMMAHPSLVCTRKQFFISCENDLEEQNCLQAQISTIDRFWNLNFPDSSLKLKNHSKLSRSLLTDTLPRNGRISNNPTVAVPDHGPTIPPSFRGSIKKNQISAKLLRKVQCVLT